VTGSQCNSRRVEVTRSRKIIAVRFYLHLTEATSQHTRHQSATSATHHSSCLTVAAAQWRIQGPKGHFPPKTHEKLYNHYEIVADSSVKYVPLDGFYDIQILFYQTQFWPYDTPQTHCWGGNTLSSFSIPSTPSAPRNRHWRCLLNPITMQRHCVVAHRDRPAYLRQTDDDKIMAVENE